MKIDVSLDVDNVLRNICVPICKIYNAEFKTQIKPEDISTWDLSSSFKEIEEAYVKEYFFKEHAKEVFETAPLEQELYPLTMRILNDRYNIHLVTHQLPGNEQFTINWLKNNDIKYHSLHFTGDKGIVKSKVLVDDSIDNLVTARASGIIPVCYTQNWNKLWTGGRVDSLAELSAGLSTMYGRGK